MLALTALHCPVVELSFEEAQQVVVGIQTDWTDLHFARNKRRIGCWFDCAGYRYKRHCRQPDRVHSSCRVLGWKGQYVRIRSWNRITWICFEWVWKRHDAKLNRSCSFPKRKRSSLGSAEFKNPLEMSCSTSSKEKSPRTQAVRSVKSILTSGTHWAFSSTRWFRKEERSLSLTWEFRRHLFRSSKALVGNIGTMSSPFRLTRSSNSLACIANLVNHRALHWTRQIHVVQVSRVVNERYYDLKKLNAHKRRKWYRNQKSGQRDLLEPSILVIACEVPVTNCALNTMKTHIIII